MVWGSTDPLLDFMYSLIINGREVDYAHSYMLLVEEAEHIVACKSCDEDARIEVWDEHGMIARRAYPWEEVEDPKWPWKQGLRIVK